MDKVGQPYILHPLRVMLRLDSLTEKMVGVLHDLIEDTGWTLEKLTGQGYPPEVIVALDRLTRRPKEEYEDFIERLKNDSLARRVKLADLEDNLDVSRLPEITSRDLARLDKYRRAREVLMAVQALARVQPK
ncbi:MAG: GTP pyrophosphokinase [Thermodesulfobacteriota bacterium]